VVESEQVVGRAVCDTLERLGYRVPALVTRAEDALEAIPTAAPQLVLMEVFLPGEIDGIEAAARIHSQYDLPVICMTSRNDEKTLQRLKSASLYGFVSKPVTEHCWSADIRRRKLQTAKTASMSGFSRNPTASPTSWTPCEASCKAGHRNPTRQPGYYLRHT